MITRAIFTTCVVVMLMPFSACDQRKNHSSGPGSSKEAGSRAAAVDPALHARELLGNPNYPAICYGGYRGKTRNEATTLEQLKEDLRILAAMGVKLLRTYNTQQYPEAESLLTAIDELRQEDAEFEMYVMLGAWIECEAAWSSEPNHEAGNVENNTAEIAAAVRLANQHPETVKVIAVGNEAMVHWASSYFVRPAVILKWVNHLQDLKTTGGLPEHVWVTSSDNYAAWGGADSVYHTDDLTALLKAVDYVSLHTYPFHETYHSPKFWIAPQDEEALSPLQRADSAMSRALALATSQYESTANYIKSLGIEKPIHIGETGWATNDNSNYGATGSRAADEYKASLYYDAIREWTNSHRITCFYFEAFDEQWKDAGNPDGSENHFGLINLQGEAKFSLWDEVDSGLFDGLKRDGASITKTRGGKLAAIKENVLAIPSLDNLGGLAISTMNTQRKIGDEVTENQYVLLHASLVPDESNLSTYPSELVKLNVWEGTCGMTLSDGVLRVSAGTGDWWGCALEIQGDGKGENLSRFNAGHLHFEIRGDSQSRFQLGFQTGLFSQGTQADYFVTFGANDRYRLSDQWTSYEIPVSDLLRDKKADLQDVTGLLYFKSDRASDGKTIEVRNIYWSQE